MLAEVKAQVNKMGESFYEKEGQKSLAAPMDGDWKQAGSEDKCATIYGDELMWATGDIVKLHLASKGHQAAFSNSAGGLVTMKLNLDDPERPLMVFEGGDLW